jgi:hypothetical protein
LQDGAALLDGLIGAQDQGQGAEHEHDRAPSGGLGENVGGTARTEGRLAAGSAESTGQIGSLAALQKHNDDQHKGVQDEKTGEEPSREAEADDDDSKTNQNGDGPFHPSRHFKTSHKFKQNHDARLKPGAMQN